MSKTSSSSDCSERQAPQGEKRQSRRLRHYRPVQEGGGQEDTAVRPVDFDGRSKPSTHALRTATQLNIRRHGNRAASRSNIIELNGRRAERESAEVINRAGNAKNAIDGFVASRVGERASKRNCSGTEEVAA